MIRFEVLGKPEPQGSKTSGQARNGRRFVRESNKALPAWRQRIQSAAQQHAPAQLLEGALQVTLFFRMPVPKSAPKRRRLAATKKPDIDKIARACLDACTHVIWRDDAQVTDLIVHKELAYDAAPGVTIWIEDAWVEAGRLPEEARA